MTTPQPSITFFALPGEIRNQIYGYALVPGDVYPHQLRPTTPNTTPPTSLEWCIDFATAMLEPFCHGPRLFKRGWWCILAISHNTKLAPMISRLWDSLLKSMDGLFMARLRHLNLLPTTKSRSTLPGFQLLATCKQALREGQHRFYAQNTFHIPAGSISESHTWLHALRPEHKALIKSVSLTLSLADLTPEVLRDMDIWADAKGCDLSDDENPLLVVHVLRYLNDCVWKDKLGFLEEWDGLERIGLRSEERGFEIDGGRCKGSGRGLSRVYEELMPDVVCELMVLVGRRGWKRARAWLMRGGKLAEGGRESVWGRVGGAWRLVCGFGKRLSEAVLDE